MTDTLAEHAAPDLKAGTPLVEMEGVGKSYGAIRALEGINLTVNAGEVACVLGDNGAGKSTLIKIIAGLHPYNEGELLVDGKPVNFSTVQAGLGVGNEFIYIIAAVVGGALLTGGYGSAAGAAVGAFIFGMTTQGIVFAGFDPNWFYTFLGAMLLLAVLVNLYVKNYASTRR